MTNKSFETVKYEVENFADTDQLRKLHLAFSLLAEFYLELTDTTSYKHYKTLADTCKRVFEENREPNDVANE